MIMQTRAGGGVVQFALRIPIEMRDKVKEIARSRGRSVNSEIVCALTEYVATENEKTGEPLTA